LPIPEEPLQRRWISALGVVLACFPLFSQAQLVEPFRTRNLNPLVAIFGLPAWRTIGEHTEFSFTSELANHYRLSVRGEERMILDGETWRNAFAYSRPIGDTWAFSAEVPVYEVSGGILDDIVDGWHSIFRLPDGGRNNRPEREILFELARGTDVFYGLSSDETGIGDVQLSVGRRFGADGRLHFMATLKLPTGDEDILAGSGASDVAITILRTRSGTWRNRDAGLFWGLGIFGLGDADRIRFDQRDSGCLGLVGGSIRLTQRFGLKLQIDTHRNLYSSLLEEIGEKAVQATIGGWYETSNGPVIDFGVNEDLEVSTSPDVVLHVNVRWRW
jgi:hypothetical protein